MTLSQQMSGFFLYSCSTVFIWIILIIIAIIINFDSVFLACFFVFFYSRLNTKLFLSFSFSFSFLKYVVSVFNFRENKQKRRRVTHHVCSWQPWTYWSLGRFHILFISFFDPIFQPAASKLNSNTIFHFNGLIHCWKWFESNNKINQKWLKEWIFCV